MKIGIVGAGLQGEGCAKILVHDSEISEVYLGDIDRKRLNFCEKSIDSNKLHTKLIDANNHAHLVDFLSNCDVCIDMLLPEYCSNVMKAALDVGINYVNTAFDTPFWGNIVNGEELYLDKEFKEKGLTALLGCGDSPGLVNVFVKKYCDKLDTVDSVIIKGIYSNSEYNPLDVWNPGWSLKQAYIDFITPPYIYRNNEFIEMKPFSEVEKIEYNGYGMHDIALHSHEEAYSLPRTITNLKNCEFKYEIDKYAATLYTFGFNKDKIVEVDNNKINASEFLFKLIKEQDSKKVNVDSNDDYYSILEIAGTKDKQNKTFKVLLKPLYFNREEVLKTLGTLKIDVALPCVVGVKCLSSAKKGVIFAEELDPEKFISILNNYVSYEEIVIE